MLDGAVKSLTEAELRGIVATAKMQFEGTMLIAGPLLQGQRLNTPSGQSLYRIGRPTTRLGPVLAARADSRMVRGPILGHN